LLNNGFVECDITVEPITNKLTTLGQIAASIGEIHPLVLSEWIQKWNWFCEFDPVTIIGLCACFCDVKVAEEHRMSFPHTENTWLKHRIEELRTTYLYYEDCENEQHIHTGLDYVNALNYDMTDFVMEWCACSTEVECKGFIQNQVAEKGISIGDFCKAILKISTIVKELSMIAESMGEIECLHKFSQVDGLILKYITTAQSLYI
jgi:superfamily II RNA helicase